MQRSMVAVLMMAGLMISIGSPVLPAVARSTPATGDLREFEVMDGRIIGLSPDGSRFAVSQPLQQRLCIFDAATLAEVTCAATDEIAGGARLLDAVWSPDSTRLAFGEDDAQYGADSDLYVLDAASGSITNLTGDNYAGDAAEAPGTLFVDLAPAWTPDGQSLTFSRTSWPGGVATESAIAQIAVGGGEVQIRSELPIEEDALISSGTGWSPDGATFYYSVTSATSRNRETGIWAFDPSTGAQTPVATGGGEQLGPLALLAVSPAGDRLLGWYPESYNGFSPDQQFPVLIDPATGTITPVKPPRTVPTDHPGFTVPAFSPDGSMLLGLTTLSEGEAQLWTIELATGTTVILVEDLENAMIEVGRTPTWAANGNVMTGRYPIGNGYLLSITGMPAANA